MKFELKYLTTKEEINQRQLYNLKYNAAKILLDMERPVRQTDVTLKVY